MIRRINSLIYGFLSSLSPKPAILTSLQAGRGLAAFIVVCFHARFIFQEIVPSWDDNVVFHLFTFGHAGVQFFFVLSGFIILNIHWKDLGTPPALWPYLKKRFIRIYPILWIILTGAAVLYFYSSSFVYPAYHRDPLALLSSYLLVHLDTSKHYAIDVIWTLYHEVLFYALFSLALLHKKSGAFVLSLWMAGSALSLLLPPLPFALAFLFSPYHLLFGAGMVACLILRKKPVIRAKPALLLGAIAFATGATIDAILPLPEDKILNDLLYGAGSFFLLMGGVQMEKEGKLKFPSWMVLLGDASYVIYLVHFVALQFMVRSFHLFSVLPPLFSFFLLIFLATAAGLFIHLMIEKPLLKYLGKFR